MLRIQMLGGFQASDDEKPIAKLQSERLQALLAYLVLHRPQPLSRQQLAVTFWPDTTDAQARTNLRTLIARLREALPDADQFLAIDAQTVQWRSAAPGAIDVIEFEQALTANRLADVVAVYRGDLLPGCYDDWITSERERLRQEFQHALDRLIDQAEQQRRFAQAIGYAQRLLRHDPLHETTYRHLMRLQLASGDRSDALRSYHACATMLRDELGVEPSSETRMLYVQLLKVDEPVVEALAEPVRTLFVGRQTEWAQLLAMWRSAATGRSQLVLITGEAGIGKTHLAEHLLAHLDRQGVTTITARSYATERNSAYAPISQWLRAETIRARLNTLDQVWLIEVSRLAPWLHADRLDLPAPGPLTEAWQRQRLFEALAHAALIRGEPLLMLLDDVQWCDRETLDWLHFLLQFDPTAPLLIVATLRQEEADDSEALSTWRLLLQKHDCLTEIPLARFDAPTTTALASSLSEHDLPSAEAARIYRETEGNPLFVVEMMRAAGHMTDQAVVMAEQALPPKVQATIQYRLSQLSANAQALIQIAAVIGREFTFEVLARASETNEDALVQGLDELWRKHIVHEQGASGYDFSHDKIRVVAYAALSATRRRVLHRKVAEALVSVYAANLNAQSGAIAQHFEIAEQTEQAVEFYRRAAGAAQRIYANEEAINYYQHLLQSDLTRHVSPRDACAIKLALGEVWRVNGQWPQAEAINREALAQAEKLGVALLRAKAQRALADVTRLQGHYDAALEWLTQAEAGFESAGDQRGVVSTLWTMGEVYWFKGDHPRALAALDRQLHIATEIDDQRGICEALDTMGMVHWSQGDWDRSIECCLKSIAIAETLGYKLVITRAAITLGNVGKSRYDYPFAMQWYRTAYDVARTIDDRQVVSWALDNVAEIFNALGDFRHALAYHLGALGINLETNDVWTACLTFGDFGDLLKNLGANRQAGELYEQAVKQGRKLNIPSYLSNMLSRLATLRLEQQCVDEAAALYAEAQILAAQVAGEQLAGEDARFDLAILEVQLQYSQKRLTGSAAVTALERLLDEQRSPRQQADLHYAAWRIDPEAEFHRRRAVELYRALGLNLSLYLYRLRYHELTGETLPEPPLLPGLPDVQIPEHVDVETLMTQLTAIADKLFDNLP